MDVKSAFLYGKIDEEVYVCQPLGFEDSAFLGDLLLVQVYVDDIIFSSTKKSMHCIESLMHEKFQMSSMGDLTFFLGLQVKQKKDGIFISQDKYVEDILKKFGFTEVKTARTPMETQKPLLKDEDGARPDIMFVVYAYARYQVNPKVSHLHAVNRIFGYLKGQPKLCLWYLKDSPFDLVAYTDSDYARASLDRKSITRGKAKKSVKLMMEKLFRMELELMLVPQPSDPTESVADEAVHKGLGNSLVRVAATASSLESEQDSGNIIKTRSKATPNESSSLGTTSGGGLRCQETIGDTIAQTRVLDLEKTKTTQHNEIASLKRRVKKLEKKNRSRTYKLKRLYKVGLIARVESSCDEESLGEDASKQERIDAIDADEEMTMVSVQNVDEEMFDVNVLNSEEVFVAEQEVAIKDVSNVVSTAGDAITISAATTTTATNKTVDDITLAQALMEIKSTKPKEKGVVIQELGELEGGGGNNNIFTTIFKQSHDKGKWILIEPEKPMKKKRSNQAC
ncbi:uncharacterized mitochondrial protein-like protein [Tanacetum coccineum]